MIDKLLRKAEQALETARIDAAAGDPGAAIHRYYFAAYYAAWAMFAAAGAKRPRTRAGLVSEFGRRFVKDGPLAGSHGAGLSRLEQLRAFAVNTLEEIPGEELELARETAEAFVRAVAEHLASAQARG